MTHKIKLLCIVSCIPLLMSGCAHYSWQEHTITKLVYTFGEYKDKEDARKCFEWWLGPGLTGVTEYGDIYEKWEGSESKEVANIAQIGGGGTRPYAPPPPAYITQYKDCRLEVNFRNNKVYKYKFTGQCGKI